MFRWLYGFDYLDIIPTVEVLQSNYKTVTNYSTLGNGLFT